MDAANIFDQYIFDNSCSETSSSFEKMILSDQKLKSEFISYLNKLGSKFLTSSPKTALKAFVKSELTADDCSILVKLLQFETKWAYGIENYISEVLEDTSDDSRIFLFDSYLQDHLSKSAKMLFDMCLEYSQDFASDFKVYLMTVNGICREAHQNDMDFGVAMKKLTKEQLREIIGPRHEADVAASAPDAETENPKVHRIKPWIWQVASIAAVVVIAFTAVLRIEQNSRQAVDNAIYACADINTDLARSGGKAIEIDAMTDDELKNAVPTLRNLYQTASTTDEIADNGYTLAMVYLKLHERDKAAYVLNQLISRFDGNEDYAESVNKWKSILNLIK